jgi:hypothetical protein
MRMRSFVKFFLVLAALTAGTFSLPAQIRLTDWGRQRERRFNRQPVKEKWDVRINVAASPIHAANMFVDGLGWSYEIVGDYMVDDFRTDMMSRLYSDYYGPTRTLGAIGIGVDYAVSNWFSASLDFAAASFWRSRYSAVNDSQVGSDSGTAFYLLPRAKFMYMNRRKVRLYGSFGIGAVLYGGFDTLNYRVMDSDGVHFVNNSFRACAQFSPIGVEFGRKLFGFAEIGAGTLYVGMQAGIGYKF